MLAVVYMTVTAALYNLADFGFEARTNYIMPIDIKQSD